MRAFDMSRDRSGPGPLFNETEAGRVSTFGVVPRDEFGNIRDILAFGLNDTLEVRLQGAEQDTEQQTPSVSLSTYPLYQFPPLQYEGDDKAVLATCNRLDHTSKNST
eukprot:COSAG04_NODE_14921_length_550_cov_0.496674_1_plen_106_part_10